MSRGLPLQWVLPVDAFQDRFTTPSQEEAEVFESGGFVAAGFPWCVGGVGGGQGWGWLGLGSEERGVGGWDEMVAGWEIRGRGRGLCIHVDSACRQQGGLGGGALTLISGLPTWALVQPFLSGFALGKI